jgi:hypothetical protein
MQTILCTNMLITGDGWKCCYTGLHGIRIAKRIKSFTYKSNFNTGSEINIYDTSYLPGVTKILNYKCSMAQHEGCLLHDKMFYST